MYDSWTCLMVERGPGLISEEVRLALKIAACDLYLRQWEKMRIVNDVCDGIIETDWRTFVVHTRSGFLFRARIENVTGGYQVNFLFNQKDLERGSDVLRKKYEEDGVVWNQAGEPFPIEELYQFGDSQVPRGNHTLH